MCELYTGYESGLWVVMNLFLYVYFKSISELCLSPLSSLGLLYLTREHIPILIMIRGATNENSAFLIASDYNCK